MHLSASYITTEFDHSVWPQTPCGTHGHIVVSDHYGFNYMASPLMSGLIC